MGRLPPAVRYLLIANALVFVVTLVRPDLDDRMTQWLACWFPRHEHFAAWQVVTYMFMHGGPAHIFFNMFALFSFGLVLEQLWGARRFLVFYFLCGIGAAVVQETVNWFEFHALQTKIRDAGLPQAAIDTLLRIEPRVDPDGSVYIPRMSRTMEQLYWMFRAKMVGASGAIYGIFVAFGLLFPNAKLRLLFLPVPVAAKYFIPVLLALDLLSGLTGFSLFGGGIAHFAHLGGALIGFLLMWLWRSRARRGVEAVEGLET